MRLLLLHTQLHALSQRTLVLNISPHTCSRVHVQEGKFGEAGGLADAVFAGIPLVVAATKNDAAELKAALKVATEYKTAVRIMLTARATDTEDAGRQMELAALMTHCSLEPAHLMLALNLAMSVCYKFQNFIHAAGFARRLLELPDINSAKNAALATKVRVCASYCAVRIVVALLPRNCVSTILLLLLPPAPPRISRARRRRRCCRSASSRRATRTRSRTTRRAASPSAAGP